ncbi:MAG TPA: glycosyltransferase [Thermoplasmata archaeon]|nr:glycosyltransferase [Thermoplasmata archaeon]
MSAQSPSPTGGTRPVVSIVLATLNERDNLPHVLDRIFRQSLPSCEVVVVDDGSTDGTREFVTDLAQREPRLRPIFHDGKQTTLRAQCQGIEAARGELLIVMDADLQHPPELIPEMVRELRTGAGLVVASRYAPGGSPGPRTRFRAVLSWGAERIAKLLLREARRVSDPVSGFFGFRRESFVPLDPRYRGYKLLLFVLVMNQGRRCAEVGFRFEPRTHGASKVTQSFDFIRVFLIETLLAKRLERTLRRNPRLGTRLPPASDYPPGPRIEAPRRDQSPPGGGALPREPI